MDFSKPYKPALQTERLDLLLFNGSDEHYQASLDAINNPVAYATMGDYGIHSRADFDHLLNRTRLRRSLFITPNDSSASEEPVGQGCQYVVKLKDGGCIGGVSLAQRGPRLAPDIGWAIDPNHHSNGYASEAAAELLRYAREELHFKEIISWPNAANTASCKVATKIGLVVGGKMKDRDSGELVTVYTLPGMEIEGVPEIWF